MEENITVSSFGLTQDGQTPRLFRIPNNTDDFIEITNYGCTIKSIYVHSGRDRLQNLLCGFDTLNEYESGSSDLGFLFGTTLAPELGHCLAHKVWEIEEVGDCHVLFSCVAPTEENGLGVHIKAGARVMWVNLNRLIIDLFLTPEKPLRVDLSSTLSFQLAEKGIGDTVRTFCPKILWKGSECLTEDTPYRNMTFLSLDEHCPPFLHTQEDIKPMAEIANEQAGLAISAYGTSKLLTCRRLASFGGIQICQSTGSAVDLNGGETLTERLIYGFDRLHAEDDDTPVLSPFAAFF